MSCQVLGPFAWYYGKRAEDAVDASNGVYGGRDMPRIFDRRMSRPPYAPSEASTAFSARAPKNHARGPRSWQVMTPTIPSTSATTASGAVGGGGA